MKMYKIAFTPEQNRKKIDDLEGDFKDLKKDLKKAESEINKLTKEIDNLNIGGRRFWQQQSVFTSLQRKIERFEKMELEWGKFKAEIKDEVRNEIEKAHRASVRSGAPLS